VTTLSLRLRLTIWYTLALLVVLCLFGVAVLREQGRLGLRRVDRELEALTATVRSVLHEEFAELDDARTAAGEALKAVTAPERAGAILDTYGEPLAVLRRDLDLTDSLPSLDGVHTWTINAPSGAWRVQSQPYAVEAMTLVLVVGSRRLR
jgi:hypothetical protein